MPRIVRLGRSRARAVPRVSQANYSRKRAYNSKRRIGGHGAYTVETGPWARRVGSLGSVIGGHYGGSTGRSVGEYIGKRVGYYGSRLLGGSGGYTLSDYGRQRLAPQTPVFESFGNEDGVCITHREYLGDILTSSTPGAFKVDTFGINPSEQNVFPWLSHLAQTNFQQYKFDGLAFEFKSFSADALNSTNTALGSVFSCVNYDYTDEDFVNRSQIENSDWAKSCKPSENVLIPVECKPRLTAMSGLLYLVNGATIPRNVDPKTYYLGKLSIATQGFQGASVNIGSLYVTYKVRLYKPILMKPLAEAHIVTQARSGVTTSNHFGTASITSNFNTDSLGVELSGSVMTIHHKRLQVGMRLMLWYAIVGGIATVIQPTMALSANAVGLSYNMDSSGNPYTASSNTMPWNTGSLQDIAVTRCVVFEILDNTSDVTITLSGGTLPTTANGQFNLFQINGTDLSRIGDYNPDEYS